MSTPSHHYCSGESRPDQPIAKPAGIARRDFIRASSLLSLGSVVTGCVPFREAGTEQVRGTTQRIGPVTKEVVGYRSLIPVGFPTKENPILRVKVEKNTRIAIQYNTPVHTERVFKRQPTPLQHALESSANIVSRTFDSHPIAGLIELGLSPAHFLLAIHPSNPPPKEETKRERIIGSDEVMVSFKEETGIEAAGGELFRASGIGETVTNPDGIAEFRAKPELFDRGLEIQHAASNRTYLVERAKLERKVQAGWYPTVKTVHEIYSTSATAIKIRRIVRAGGGPAAIVIALIIDFATDLLLGIILEAAATRTVIDYHWQVLELPRAMSPQTRSSK